MGRPPLVILLSIHQLDIGFLIFYLDTTFDSKDFAVWFDSLKMMELYTTSTGTLAFRHGLGTLTLMTLRSFKIVLLQLC